MEAFLDDRDQDINGHRDPDLSSHGVLGGAEETLDPKVLLDPLEEQLDLPTALVQSADGQRRKMKGGVERVHGLVQIDPERIGRIQLPGLCDQLLGQVGVDSPIARLVRIGKGGSADRLPQSHVVKLVALRREASFDVAQALAIRELSEGHASELFVAAQRSNAMIASITIDDPMERGPGQKLHDLREQGLADVHELSSGCQSRKNQAPWTTLSNRHHLKSTAKSTCAMTCRYRLFR